MYVANDFQRLMMGKGWRDGSEVKGEEKRRERKEGLKTGGVKP